MEEYVLRPVLLGILSLFRPDTSLPIGVFNKDRLCACLCVLLPVCKFKIHVSVMAYVNVIALVCAPFVCIFQMQNDPGLTLSAWPILPEHCIGSG